MTYFGHWYAQARIWDSSSIGAGVAALVITLLQITVKLADKAQQTVSLTSGIVRRTLLTDKRTYTVTAKDWDMRFYKVEVTFILL